MKAARENAKFLRGVPLPEGLGLEADLAKACGGVEMVVLASPSQYMRPLLERFKPHFRKGSQILVNVAKGIEVDSLKSMGELVHELLGDCRYAALSGPSHAEEVSRAIPTAVVAASSDPRCAKAAQAAFMNAKLRVYTSSDVRGVELGGAIKNVLAVAAGIVDGMGLGDNTKAALMTRGVAEMARLGVALGGKKGTFSGLSGLGDLIVTCVSRHSRNRHVGEELGKGRRIEEINASMGRVVAEGVKTARSLRDLAARLGVETPIAETVYRIIYEGKNPAKALDELMTRKAKDEED
jgi:glycerol-3-phosphate dehydrogenase (NAD(P)+)